MKVAFVLVAALLLGACQTDNLVTKQANDPRPTSVDYIAKPKGPQVAKGAVLFINGVDGTSPSHHYDFDTPNILYWFSGAGFDVYRLNLAPKDQVPFGRVLQATDRAISDIRRQNYRKIFVVGQSAGGVSALVTLIEGGNVADGAIAFAPVAVGNAPKNQQIEWHTDIVSKIGPTRRVAIFHFDGDDLVKNWHKEAVAISSAKLANRRNAMIRVPSNASGHFGFESVAFQNTYGLCLAEFLATDDPNERVCPP
jgi:alpha-beta hydrolase superfamily lysophospholipase